MQKIRKESGVTMAVLVITIIVLAVVASIIIQYSIDALDYSKEKEQLANLSTVQHAIYERYEQYKITKDEDFFIGTVASNPGGDVTWKDEGIYWEASEVDKKYYTLSKEDLKKIGIEDSKDTYIINYYTGEVYNVSSKKSAKGTLLYLD